MSTEVNIPLLRKVVEWAEAEAAKPEIDRRWHQGAWVMPAKERAEHLASAMFPAGSPWRDVGSVADRLEHACGTSFCIAGYVAQSIDARYATETSPEGMPHVSDFAAEALGIDLSCRFSPPPGRLFHAENTIEDVRRIAEELAGERL